MNFFKKYEGEIIVLIGIILAFGAIYFPLKHEADEIKKEQKRIENLTTKIYDDDLN